MPAPPGSGATVVGHRRPQASPRSSRRSRSAGPARADQPGAAPERPSGTVSLATSTTAPSARDRRRRSVGSPILASAPARAPTGVARARDGPARDRPWVAFFPAPRAPGRRQGAARTPSRSSSTWRGDSL